MGFLSDFIDNKAFKFDPFGIIPDQIKQFANPVLQPLESIADQVSTPIKQVVKPITNVGDGVLDVAENVGGGISSFLNGDWFFYIVLAGGIVLAILLLK